MPPRRNRATRRLAPKFPPATQASRLPTSPIQDPDAPFESASTTARPLTPRPPSGDFSRGKPLLPKFSIPKPTLGGYQPKQLPSSPILDPDSPFQEFSVRVRQSTPRPQNSRPARAPSHPVRLATPARPAPPAPQPAPAKAASPLPPSSPPSLASDDPEIHPGTLPQVEVDTQDFMESHPPSEDDPFGFFATERKLKAKRLHSHPAPRSTLPSPTPFPPPIETAPSAAASPVPLVISTEPASEPEDDLYTDRPVAPSPAASTPTRAHTVTPSGSTASQRPTTPPPRARRQKHGREPSLARSDTPSVSPTPSKSVLTSRAASVQATPVAKRARRGGKENWAADDSDPPSPPLALRRPATRAAARRRAVRGGEAGAKGKAKATRAQVESDEEEDVVPKRRKPASRTGKATAKPRSRQGGPRRAAAREKEKDVPDEEEQEKHERQRQERLDYFKKLNDYKLKTEKVYVV